MTAGVRQYIKKETIAVYYAVKDSTGVYPYGSTGSISNGAGAMMAQAVGFTDLTVNRPAPAAKNLVYDGGVGTTYYPRPVEGVTGTKNLIILDEDLSAVVNSSIVFTEGQHDIELKTNKCYSVTNLALVVVSRAESRESGSEGEEGFVIEEYLNVRAFQLEPGNSGNPGDDPRPIPYQLIFEEPTTMLNGVAISNATHGHGRGYKREYWSENPVIYGAFVGNNSATTFSIPAAYAPVAEAASAIQNWADGSELTYGASAGNFNVSGQTLTFVTAPADGVVNIFKLEYADVC